MDTNQLLTVIEKGFADVRREMAEGFAKVDERFARVEDEAHKTRILVEDLRDKMSWVDEADSQPIAKRVSALEVRVTKLEDKDKRRR